MESNRQDFKFNGNGINYDFSNQIRGNISQEKYNQDTPFNQDNFSNPSTNYNFKSSLTSNVSQNQNQNPSNNFLFNFNQNKPNILQNQNHQNSENIFLNKKREEPINEDNQKNDLISNPKTEEKSVKKQQRIQRLVVTKIKSSSKKLVSKSRFEQHEIENKNFNRQGFLEKLNSSTSIYSVTCPEHHIKNHTECNKKIIEKNLENEFDNRQNEINLNLNEKDDRAKSGKKTIYKIFGANFV